MKYSSYETDIQNNTQVNLIADCDGLLIVLNKYTTALGTMAKEYDLHITITIKIGEPKLTHCNVKSGALECKLSHLLKAE